MRFVLLASSLLIAWRMCLVASLRHYFAAQLIAALVIEGTLLRFNEHSHLYIAIFVVADVIVFVTMIPLVWTTLSQHPLRSLAVANGLAIGLGLSAISASGRDLTFYQWVGAMAGAFLVLCAVCSGMGAAYLSGTSRKIALSLMVMWFVQALYEFGFTLHIESPVWLNVNEFLPSMVVASGCLWLALFCRNRANDH